MLDTLRQHSKSFIIWFLFGIIIISFVVTFGPGSMKLTCGQATKAGSLAGREITNADVRFALALFMPRNAPPTYRALVLDRLLRREILHREAERLGIVVTDEEVANLITKRRQIYVLGISRDLFDLGAWPRLRDRDGKMVPAPDYYHDLFKKWVQYQLGMKVTDFEEQQKRELMALRAEETIRNGVLVSEQEARAKFELDNHSLELEFAKFKVDDFAKEILVDRADVMKWLALEENVKQVDERFKQTKWKYTGLAHERRVRHLLVKVDAKATEEAKKAARGKLEQLKAKLDVAPHQFGALAQALSEDAATRPSGGDLGWREKDKLGFGAAFGDEVFKLKPMVVSGVLASDQGLHLVLVEGERKGDVDAAQARPWLAEEILVRERAKGAARKVADEALRRMRKGQPMADIFPTAKEDEPPPEDKEPKPDGEEESTPPPPKDKAAPQRFHPLLPTLEKVTVPRTENAIGQIGKVEGLVRKVWQLSAEEPVLPEVVVVPGTGTSLGSLVVIRLKQKIVPDPKEFAKNREHLMTELLDVKREDAVARWVFARCEALRADNQIKLAKQYSDIVFYTGEGEQRKESVYKYVPCQRLERFGQAGAPPQ